MRHKKKENRGRPSEKPVEIVRQFTREYDDSIWHYDLDKTDKGPYLVEFTDPTYDKLEKLYEKVINISFLLVIFYWNFCPNHQSSIFG